MSTAAARRAFYDAAHAQYLRADAATRGNFFRREARQLGLDPERTFFAGGPLRASLASEELLAFFDADQRITVGSLIERADLPTGFDGRPTTGVDAELTATVLALLDAGEPVRAVADAAELSTSAVYAMRRKYLAAFRAA